VENIIILLSLQCFDKEIFYRIILAIR